MGDAALQDQKEALRRATEAVRAFLSGRDEIGGKSRELIDLLCQKSQALLAEPAIALEDVRFTQADFNQWLFGERDAPDARQVRKCVRGAAEIINAHAPGISIATGQPRQRLVLRETDTRGGRGNIKYYYLDLEPFDTQPDADAVPTPRTNGDRLRYELTSRPVAHWLAKPFANVELTPARFAGLLGLFAIAAFFLPLLALQALTQSASLLALVAVCGAAALYLVGLRPLLSAVSDRIAIAPGWMYRLDMPSAQLISIKAGGAQTLLGHPLRRLQLVAFEAKCPACGGRVVPMNGGGEFRGRIIGQCRENPREHVYSFDHVTRIGVPLRADSYQGNHQKC